MSGNYHSMDKSRWTLRSLVSVGQSSCRYTNRLVPLVFFCFPFLSSPLQLPAESTPSPRSYIHVKLFAVVVLYWQTCWPVSRVRNGTFVCTRIQMVVAYMKQKHSGQSSLQSVVAVLKSTWFHCQTLLHLQEVHRWFQPRVRPSSTGHFTETIVRFTLADDLLVFKSHSGLQTGVVSVLSQSMCRSTPGLQFSDCVVCFRYRKDILFRFNVQPLSTHCNTALVVWMERKVGANMWKLHLETCSCLLETGMVYHQFIKLSSSGEFLLGVSLNFSQFVLFLCGMRVMPTILNCILRTWSLGQNSWALVLSITFGDCLLTSLACNMHLYSVI